MTEFRIVVIDHGSNDGTTEIIGKQFPEVIVLNGSKDMWWTAATNLGVLHALKAGSDYILTLNNDLEVPTGYLSSMKNAAVENPRSLIGSVSLVSSDKASVYYSGRRWNPATAKYLKLVDVQNVEQLDRLSSRYLETNILTGRGTLIPKSTFDEIGLFDAEQFPHYMADEDFTYRAHKSGYKLIIDTKSRLFSHIEATGHHKFNFKSGRKALHNFFYSTKSPNNLKIRWKWAQKHAKIPLLYFLLDYARVLGGQLTK